MLIHQCSAFTAAVSASIVQITDNNNWHGSNSSSKAMLFLADINIIWERVKRKKRRRQSQLVSDKHSTNEKQKMKKKKKKKGQLH